MEAGTLNTPDLLRRVMDDAGIDTQTEFAAAVGMSQGQVNRWLTGAANPPERRLRMVIEAVGLNPAAYGLRPRRAGGGELRAVPDSAPAWFTDEIEQLRAQLTEMHKLLKIINGKR